MKRKSEIAKSSKLVVFCVGMVVVWLGWSSGIFWDNVLFVSKIGVTLFENGFYNWNSIPREFDAGHPPLFGSFLALIWTFFGKSLVVSHITMMPIVFGLLWQLLRFISHFIKEPIDQVLALILILADPTLLSSLTLIGPEPALLFFFFLALNALLRNNDILKIFGLVFLSLISLRGMMLCAGLCLLDIVLQRRRTKGKLFLNIGRKILIVYGLSSLPSLAFLLWHYSEFGWIRENPAGTYGDNFSFSGVQDYLENLFKNVGIFIFRLIDFGRIGVVLFLVFHFTRNRKSFLSNPIKLLLLLMTLSLGPLIVFNLMFNVTVGHRYYIPIYVVLSLVVYILLDKIRFKRILYALMILMLILGNFWIYSDKIAQGWDSSLAHISYWSLRSDAIKYMDDRNIAVDETATFFPNYTKIDYVDLNGDQRSFLRFTGSEKFVFYSNVYNLSDKDLDALKSKYALLKVFKKRGVRIEILKRRDN